MTRKEWEDTNQYTCSLPTSPPIGFVYAVGPHLEGSDPTTHPWFLRVVEPDPDDPKMAIHRGRRIILPVQLDGSRFDAKGKAA